jgi:hypothetical protein
MANTFEDLPEFDNPRFSVESLPTTDEESENDSPSTSPIESSDITHSTTSPETTTNQKPNTPSHPYTRTTQPQPSITSTNQNFPPRPTRQRPMQPLTGLLPKSQPLSRALFTRLASNGGINTLSDTPHAGMGSGGKKKVATQKIIVPTKSFRTTFELGLTANEFRRA